MKHITWIVLLFWLPCLAQTDGSFMNSGGVSSDGYFYAVGEIFIVEIKTPPEEDVLQQLLVKAHPNPTSQTVHLSIEGELTNNEVQVYDLNGRLLLRARLEDSRLDLSGLSTGIYLVTSSSGEFQTFKILKI